MIPLMYAYSSMFRLSSYLDFGSMNYAEIDRARKRNRRAKIVVRNFNGRR